MLKQSCFGERPTGTFASCGTARGAPPPARRISASGSGDVPCVHDLDPDLSPACTISSRIQRTWPCGNDWLALRERKIARFPCTQGIFAISNRSRRAMPPPRRRKPFPRGTFSPRNRSHRTNAAAREPFLAQMGLPAQSRGASLPAGDARWHECGSWPTHGAHLCQPGRCANSRPHQRRHRERFQHKKRTLT